MIYSDLMKMKTKSDFIYGYPHASGRKNAKMKKMTMIHYDDYGRRNAEI